MKFVACLFRVALCAAICFPSALLHAQITATAPASTEADHSQRFDIMGGAAYSHFNPGYAHQVQAINLLGWDGSVTTWVSNLVGIEATARGLYGTINLPANAVASLGVKTSDMSEHLFLFGPSVRLYQRQHVTAGAHLLIGGSYGSFDKGFAGTGAQPFTYGIYNNTLAFASAVGAWAGYDLTPAFSVRFVGDYQPTRYGGTTQNEFAGSVGIVYRAGHRSVSQPKP